MASHFKSIDIDGNPELESLYGLKVPVLMAEEREICHYTLDFKALNLEKAVGRTHIAQVLDLPGYMKKVFITNEVTTHFFITPFKSISCTLHALPTVFSRLKGFLGK